MALTREQFEEKFSKMLDETKSDMLGLINKMESDKEKSDKKFETKIEGLTKKISDWKEKYETLDAEFTNYRVKAKLKEEASQNMLIQGPEGQLIKLTPPEAVQMISDMLTENERLVNQHNNMRDSLLKLQKAYEAIKAEYDRFYPLYSEIVKQNQTLREALLEGTTPFSKEDIETFNKQKAELEAKASELAEKEKALEGKEVGKPKLILVDNRPRVKQAIDEICEMNDNLMFENECYREEVEKLRAEVERLKYVEEEMQATQQLLEELEEANTKLKEEAYAAQAKTESYKWQNPAYAKSTDLDSYHIPKSLIDCYKDEIKIFINDAIQTKMIQYQVGSRSRFIGQELIKENPVDTSEKTEIKEFLKDAIIDWKGSAKIPSGFVTDLEKHGLTLQRGGKHSYITFIKDSRFKSTLSDTPSDKRDGLNHYSDMTKQLF